MVLLGPICLLVAANFRLKHRGAKKGLSSDVCASYRDLHVDLCELHIPHDQRWQRHPLCYGRS